MSSRETARQHRTLAQEQYKRGQYLEVMQSADKALALGYLDLSVYDIKAAALNKLVEPQDGPWRDLGFETIKLMCQKWPKNWRPYYRKAEHLRSRGSYIHAVSAIKKALEFVDTENLVLVQRKQTEIQGQREVFLIEQERRIARAGKEEKAVLVQKRRIEANRTKDFTHLLSPDILNMIVDHLMVDNPSIACRIGAVRRSWRDWMLERKGVWQNLVLGSKRPAEKAKLFLERSGDTLRKLKLRGSVDSNQEKVIAEILDGHVGGVRSISFSRHPTELLRQLAGQFHCIDELSQTPNIRNTLDIRDPMHLERLMGQDPHSLDLGTCPPGPTLRHLVITGTHIIIANGVIEEDSQSDDDEGSVDTTSPLDHLRHIETLTMSHVFMTCIVDSLVAIARRLPNLVHLTLDQVAFMDQGPGQGDVVLDRLKTFSVPHLEGILMTPWSGAIVDFFTHVTTPNLLHLDIWACNRRDYESLWSAPGLSTCLPNLISLDIGKTVFDEAVLLEALKKMPELRFLNVSFTPLGDSFLEAITRPRKPVPGEITVPELLPNLVALSIAGLEVTSLALRDFAVSRLPKPPKPQSLQPLLAPRGWAFRPSSSSALRPLSPSASQAVSPTPQPSAIFLRPPRARSSQASPRAYLRWLCLDMCEKIAPQLIEFLQTKMSFVSSGTQLLEDRVRAKGRFNWNLDYYHSCATADPKLRCHLVPIPGTRDGFEIQHTCGRNNFVEETEDPEEENIWASQWNPSSSVCGDAEELPVVEKREGKGKGKETMPTISQGSSGEDRQERKRQAPSGSGAGGSRSKKGRGKGKISIGPDGSLSGF